MTPEERAAAVWNSWPDVPGPPSEFDATMTARIAAAIRAAVAEFKERVLRVCKEDAGLFYADGETYLSVGVDIVAAKIRELE